MLKPVLTQAQAEALLETAERYRLAVDNKGWRGYKVRVNPMALDNTLYTMRVIVNQ